MSNIDADTVAGFGDEWRTYDQSELSDDESAALFAGYFAVFPTHTLDADSVGFDLGCGSGRWARHMAPRVGMLHCIDASAEAVKVARRNLHGFRNCRFYVASVDQIPLADGSMDFGYSLGVLHHVPDTAAGIASCVRKLKPGAPLLLYLYYDFEDRPPWFKFLWRISDHLRRKISQLPPPAKHGVSLAIAALVYWPLARFAKMLARLHVGIETMPLSYYKDRSFYTMRTDALDRFGTRLEHRFSRGEITQMMRRAGLENIRFSPAMPYWCVVGFKVSS